MVVAEDEAGAVADNGWAENLGGAQDRAVGGALVEARLLDQLALGVQEQDAHLLGVQVGQVQHHQVGRLRRRADPVPGVHLHGGEPASDLQGRLDLRRLGLPHAVLGAQLAEIGTHQSWEPAVLREEFVGQLHGVIASGAGAQDDREQLGHRDRERLGAEVLQALARALVGGQVAHRRVVVQPGVFVGVGVDFAGEHVRFSSFTV